MRFSRFSEEDEEMIHPIRKQSSSSCFLSPTPEGWLARFRHDSGSVAVITAICLGFLIGFVALVVDVGHLYAVRNELQNAADAAALAGARALFPLNGYPDATLIPLTEPPFCDLAVTSGRTAAANNQAGGVVNLATAPTDVETGIWNWNAKTFTPDATPSYNINAVRAIVRRDAVANQPVASWFAFIFGIESTPVNAQCVAAVGYIKKPAGAYLPIWVTNDTYTNLLKISDNNTIQAAPDPSDTFAWCAPDPVSANASYLKDAVNGVEGIPMPEESGMVNLSNGQLGSVEHAIVQQIDAAKLNNPTGYQYKDPTTGTMQTYINSDGTPVTGWLTYMLVGDKAASTDPNKLNQQGDVDSFVPVIVTDIVHEKGADGKPQWVIKFYLIPGEEKFTVLGGTPGGSPSKLYATQPVIVN
jgi:Flp pilus assembly protein TadG